MLDPLIRALSDRLDALGGGEGPHPTAIGSLILFRSTRPSDPLPALYEPAFCVVAQGAKRVLLGDRVHDYRAGQYLLVKVGLPLVGRVTRASPAEPYLGLALGIDLALLREVVDQLDAPPATPEGGSGIFVGDLEGEPIDCAVRLLRLLETPGAIPVVYPAIARELYYWLLTGPDGASLAALAAPGGHARAIGLAIRAIREGLPTPVPTDRLAAIAGMSPSSFHAHFKALTAMSPLQYQKRLRLLEARRLLMTRAANASGAALQVGYASPSQFNRDYHRMFGAPPGRDRAGHP